MTKFGFEISLEAIEPNIRRLTNQMWKLIPMREHEENWMKQLETVIVEITGLINIHLQPTSEMIQLLSKLEGLSIAETSFEIYRKTVFECIGLLQGVLHV